MSSGEGSEMSFRSDTARKHRLQNPCIGCTTLTSYSMLHSNIHAERRFSNHSKLPQDPEVVLVLYVKGGVPWAPSCLPAFNSLPPLHHAPTLLV